MRGRIVGIHEYVLRPGADEGAFLQAVRGARERGLFALPGLIEHYLLRGVKGARLRQFAAVWIFESREAWERLWGTPENPLRKEQYPESWKIWEDEVLAPFLDREPDTITFTDYEEL